MAPFPRHRFAHLLGALLGAALAHAPLAGAQPAAPLPRSAPSDSVVRLAVDGTRFAGLPFVTLLDDAELRVEPDGRAVLRVRQVVQVLEQAAVAALSERALSYVASHQGLRVDWVRVLQRNGNVVSDRAAQEQESGATAAMANPVYQEQKTRRFSLAGVAPGTIVDVQWTMEERLPPRAGDFFHRWQVNGSIPVARSQFVLDAPESFTPRIVERNLNIRRREETSGTRRRYTWAASEVAGIRAERFASDSNGVAMTVTVAAPGSWSDLAGWYHGLSKDRYVLSSGDAARVDSIVRAAGARTRADTVRAVHRWVAQDIRYLSVALGIGGYQPRRPEETIATGFGDCKDKATLFVGALRRYGITASPVLLAIAGRPDRALPSIFQFNHAIAAVRDGQRWTFTDLTADLLPYETLPESYQGAFGVLVHPDGKAEEVVFPVTPSSAPSYTTRAALNVESAGRVTARVEELPGASYAPSLRSTLASVTTAEQREGMLRQIAGRVFAGVSRADSLVTFDGRDLAAVPVIRYRVTGETVLKPVGELRLLPLAFTMQPPARAYAALAAELAAAPPRALPIEAAAVVRTGIALTELTIILPPGWAAELPKNVLATSFFGRYESNWTVQGREVRLVRRVQGFGGIFPPERISEVIVWLRTVGADDNEFLSLRPAPVP